MKYVLMFLETEQSEKEWEALDQAAREEGYAKVERWLTEHADKITHRCKLLPSPSATTVRLDPVADPVVTDGPFLEGKEVISGYAEVEVADLDEALAMVRTWPACPTVEIRPVMF